MQEHYNLSDDNYKKLMEQNVTIADLFKSVRFFDPDGTNAEIGFMGLFHYIDKKGDFNTGKMFPHKKIAQAVFSQLDIKQKIAIAEYIDDMENGEF